MKADIADPFTTADIRARGQHLDPEERDARACAAIDRHALNPEDRADLLAMLGLTPPPPPPAKSVRAPRKPPSNTGRMTTPAEPCEWPCEKCGRQMWHRRWGEESRPGRIAYGANGVCCTCYQRVLRHTEN